MLFFFLVGLAILKHQITITTDSVSHAETSPFLFRNIAFRHQRQYSFEENWKKNEENPRKKD